MTIVIVLVALWVLIQFKTGRPDGDLVRGLHPYRRLAGFIMMRRSESVVYMDSAVPAEKLIAYLAAHKDSGITLTHLLIAATSICSDSRVHSSTTVRHLSF